jgi:uncharacterized membrane protein YagU involved in acid resistance
MATRIRLKPILIGGLIAGVLDITYACIFSYVRRGFMPSRVLQSVASGALGPRAFQGGYKIAALGLAFHFLFALVFAAFYYFASRALPVMISHPFICGVLYGLGIYLVMYGIVFRVSAIHSTAYPWAYPAVVLICNLLIHMFGIGLPIALAVRKYSK